MAVPRGETVIVASSVSSKPGLPSSMSSAFMGERACRTGRAGRCGTRLNRPGSRIAGPAPASAASVPIRAGRTASPRCLVLAMSLPSGRLDRASAWYGGVDRPRRASSRTAVSWRSARARRYSEHWFSKDAGGGADSCADATRPARTIRNSGKRTWAKANPSLPHMPDLLDAIRTEAGHARRDPGLLAAFDALRLNLGTEDTAVSTLLGRGPVAALSRAKPNAIRAVLLGNRPWHVAGAVRGDLLLAADRRAGRRGRLPCRTVPGGQGPSRRRWRPVSGVRPARRPDSDRRRRGQYRVAASPPRWTVSGARP